VDDEQTILRFERRALTKLGYVVTALDSSVEALRLFQAQPENFDLVITDMTMPKMTGAELARRVLDIRPDMPIILCTGYSSLISAKEAKEIGVREFFIKPLEWAPFIKSVRKVLDN
jgi:DNA-binding NtrC family response regulator